MRSFVYERADSMEIATNSAKADAVMQFLAGGTTLLDLMKLDVMRPQRVVDINALGSGPSVTADRQGLHVSAFARMAEVADHPAVRRDYPVIAQSLQLAASAQIRNMASLGGNILQRTRCTYFRDPSWKACNKRTPGSGCAALDGVNRAHAVLGTSAACIATYAGDLAQALMALGASVDIVGSNGPRTLAFEDLHQLPGTTPHVETTLSPGDIITRVDIPAGPWTRRSLYLKIRDRKSYEFALTSAAVALDMDGDVVREARIGLGGVATKPWRAHEAEQALKGRSLTEDAATAAARVAFASARPRNGNAFKAELGRRTMVRALLQAQALKV